MGEIKLTQNFDPVVAAPSNGCGGPFSHTVNSKDYGFFKRRGGKRHWLRETGDVQEIKSLTLPAPIFASSSLSILRIKSFSLIQTGMADRKLFSPWGEKP